MSIQTLSKCALAALLCSFACLAEETELLEADVAEFTEDLDQPEAPNTEEFRVSWECAGGVLNTTFVSRPYVGIRRIPADPFYCLTLCEGHRQVSRAIRESVRDPSQRTDSWCLSHAAFYCSRLRRELEGWCWGMRD